MLSEGAGRKSTLPGKTRIKKGVAIAAPAPPVSLGEWFSLSNAVTLINFYSCRTSTIITTSKGDHITADSPLFPIEMHIKKVVSNKIFDYSTLCPLIR
jgi:hypothetical protein